MRVDTNEPVNLDNCVWLRRDAIADGLNDQKIAALVRSGEWHRVRHGAYCAGPLWAKSGPEDRHRILSRAVLLTAHPTTVLTHVSAAVERGAPTWDVSLDEVHTTRTDGKGGRREAGVVHHRNVLPTAHVEVINGVPISIAARTAVEMCTLAPVEPALVTVNGLLHSQQTTLDEVTSLAHDARFWPEGITARIVLSLADAAIESAGESRFAYFCYAQHLPRPEPQVQIFDEHGRLVARVDFALPKYGVFFEFDGREKYLRFRGPGETLADFLLREKRREETICLLTGWICIRISWSDLARPELLARRIRAILASRVRPGA